MLKVYGKLNKRGYIKCVGCAELLSRYKKYEMLLVMQAILPHAIATCKLQWTNILKKWKKLEPDRERAAYK